MLSGKAILVRFGAAVLAIWLAALVREPSALWFVLVAVFISLKYVLYDLLLRLVRRLWPAFQMYPWGWVGYGVALIFDVIFCWLSTSDTTDAGFGLFATLVVTPWMLIGAFVAMGIHTYVSQKKRRKE